MKRMDNNADLFQRVKTAIPFLITALLVGIIVVRQFVALRAKENASPKDILLGFIFSGAILIAMHIIWRPSGKDSVRNNPESAYSKNAKRYSELATLVNEKKKNADFKLFCADKTAELSKLKQEDNLKGVGVTFEEYSSYTSKLEGHTALKTENADAPAVVFTPTKKQIRIIEKVYRGKITVKPLNHLSIMTDSIVKSPYSYGVDYNEAAEESYAIGVKVVQKLVTALILGYITYDKLSRGITSDMLMDFGVNLFLVISSAWGGYSGGVKQYAVRKNDVFKRRIGLLEEFFEKEGISTEVKAH